MKKAAIVLITVLIAVVLAGCGGKPAQTDAPSAPAASAAAKPKPEPVLAGSTDLNETAGKVLELIQAKDWDNLYNYLYPDIQKAISREDFVALKKNETAHIKIEYKNYKVGTPKMVDQWVDNIQQKTYQKVAEIPYTVDVVTPRGEMNINNSIHLAQTTDDKWSYIWINKN